MQAYLYCRVSSDKQIGGFGPERQQNTVTEYVRDYTDKYNLGYVLDLEKTELLEPDLGKSAYHGYNFTKGSLGRFKQRVLSGEIKDGARLLKA
ncbi:hypothetical protein ACNPG5_03415 [Citrobacter cronae]|uniref:hypothetical protein n=1 Tax=Citrobacter freundii complex TaxID=1344959 RepID=UPI00132F5A6C|nr:MULTISPECIES: hypothetical protein [Citrobacter]MCU6198888.1 hypothetical protein [Citrobacter cronae]